MPSLQRPVLWSESYSATLVSSQEVSTPGTSMGTSYPHLLHLGPLEGRHFAFPSADRRFSYGKRESARLAARREGRLPSLQGPSHGRSRKALPRSRRRRSRCEAQAWEHRTRTSSACGGLWREGILPSLAPTGAFPMANASQRAFRRAGKAECLPSRGPSYGRSRKAPPGLVAGGLDAKHRHGKRRTRTSSACGVPLEGRHSAFPSADRRFSYGRRESARPCGALGMADCLPSKARPFPSPAPQGLDNGASLHHSHRPSTS